MKRKDCPRCGSSRAKVVGPSGVVWCGNCARFFGRNGREISVDWL